MIYTSLKACIDDLERNGHLLRITEEVDPDLEMAAIHRRVHRNGGPALLFENIRGCDFPAVSNLFGTLDRSRFLFRSTLRQVQKLIRLKMDPLEALRKPLRHVYSPIAAIHALPRRTGKAPVLFRQISTQQLPQIRSWPEDGGAFITLPQVYTENPLKLGIMNSNLGMYRIQLNGNDYNTGEEIGLHYQLHRGIGIHHTAAIESGLPLKVSIFVGGPPSHSFTAVMPLPENLPEAAFAGVLGGRRFRYTDWNGYRISADADFCIVGEIDPRTLKTEGPFGDHLGYYSLKHDFPVMNVKTVFHRKDAIWPFTVVGRPPQEDTNFNLLIQEITGPVVPSELPGLREINAVDEAGVHPLLLAIGSERYIPYENREPREILTIANAVLGFGQLSLAKYLVIAAGEDNPRLSTHDAAAFLQHVLERVDWSRDLHFQTRTTIDTLDYTGHGLIRGSKVIIAAAGRTKRKLATKIDNGLKLSRHFSDPRVVMPGVLALRAHTFTAYEEARSLIATLTAPASNADGTEFPLIIIADDSDFVSASVANFLWVTFTRSDPARDIHGIDSFIEDKHWGCRGSLIIDARIKPHHAPALEEDSAILKRIRRLAVKGASLHGYLD